MSSSYDSYDYESEADCVKRLARKYNLELSPRIFTPKHAQYLFDEDAFGSQAVDYGKAACFKRNETRYLIKVLGPPGNSKKEKNRKEMGTEMWRNLPQFVWDNQEETWIRGRFDWAIGDRMRQLNQEVWICAGIVDGQNAASSSTPKRSRCIIL